MNFIFPSFDKMVDEEMKRAKINAENEMCVNECCRTVKINLKVVPMNPKKLDKFEIKLRDRYGFGFKNIDLIECNSL